MPLTQQDGFETPPRAAQDETVKEETESLDARDPADFPISGYGRQRLLDTALRLFDEEGLNGTSARAVARAAGHRNVGAVAYHFGSVFGLLQAVLAHWQERAEQRREQLLDELEASGNVTPRAAIDAMFTPHVEFLDDPDGRRFLRVLNQTVNHPTWFDEANPARLRGNQRGIAHLLPLWEHVPEEVRVYRAFNAFGLVCFALAEQARLLDTPSPGRPILDKDTFKNDLITVMVNVFTA